MAKFNICSTLSIQSINIMTPIYLTTVTLVPCVDGYTIRCYKILPEQMRWDAGRTSCLAQGGRLTEVDSEIYFQAVKAHLIGTFTLTALRVSK